MEIRKAFLTSFAFVGSSKIGQLSVGIPWRCPPTLDSASSFCHRRGSDLRALVRVLGARSARLPWGKAWGARAPQHPEASRAPPGPQPCPRTGPGRLPRKTCGPVERFSSSQAPSLPSLYSCRLCACWGLSHLRFMLEIPCFLALLEILSTGSVLLSGCSFCVTALQMGGKRPR